NRADGHLNTFAGKFHIPGREMWRGESSLMTNHRFQKLPMRYNLEIEFNNRNQGSTFRFTNSPHGARSASD
ncbi:MAG: hypothetical protein O2960_13880, partial [Verrucomicrobia bacterium]|nr:hypothetical protein [Verrucomicrobiota bacterium]